MIVPGHERIDIVEENEEAAICRCRSREDGAAVLVVAPRDKHSAPEAMAEYRRALDAMRLLEGEGAPVVLGLEADGTRPLLLLRDFGGLPAARVIRPPEGGDDPRSGPEALARMLRAAAGAADSLSRVHRRGLVHLSVGPTNLLVHPETLEARFIGFERSEHPSLEPASPAKARPPRLLPYAAPEQFGRMSAVPDERTDLYGFGIMLYEWLTGRLPYPGSSAAELAYAHIAGEVPPVEAANPLVPRALSDIVRKCMDKDPRGRYRSASGLKADLLECLEKLERSGTIAPFETGRRDGPGRAAASGLYGRERELRELEAVLDREKSDRPAGILIGGEPGIGKTALARAALSRRGDAVCAVSGKFEPPPADLPYAGWIQAFGELVNRLLMADELQLERWRRSVGESLGEYAGLLFLWAPKLKLLLDEPEASVLPLPIAEEKSRFQYVFGLFLQRCGEALPPIVVFLDDLQWADEASLQLMDHLLRNNQLGRLTIVGAYREGERAASAWGRWRRRELPPGAPLPCLRLGALGRETLGRLLREWLDGSPERLAEVVELVMLRTGGNPFLIRQWLGQASERGWVVFDESEGSWRWDVRRMADAEDGLPFAADLSGISGLRPGRLREPLVQAAFLGRRFRLADLRELLETEDGDPEEALRVAVRRGWLLRVEGEKGGDEDARTYAFSHDRIRLAFLALVPEAERPVYHYRIGALWRGRIDSSRPDDPSLPLAVNHLNRALSLIGDEQERLELAELNYKAGSRAALPSDYEQGLAYFRRATELMSDRGWRERATLAFDAGKMRAICEYLCGHREEAIRLFEELLGKAREDLERAEIYAAWIRLESGRGHYREATELAGKALRMLGVRLPAWRGTGALLLQGLRAERRLKPARLKSMGQGEAMADSRLRAAMSILVQAGHAQFMHDKKEWVSANLKMLELTLDRGVAPESYVACAAMALLESKLRKRHRVAYEWGKLAMEGAGRHPALRTVIANACLLGIDSWRTFEPGLLGEWIREADRARFESDSLWQADQIVLIVAGLMVQFGSPLREAYGLLRRHAHGIGRGPDAEQIRYTAILAAIVQELMGGGDSEPGLFPEIDLGDPAFIRGRDGEPSTYLQEAMRFRGYLTAYFREDYDAAFEHFVRLEKLLRDRKRGESDWSSHDYYGVLIRMQRHKAAPAEERAELERDARRHLIRLRKEAKRCPANYGTTRAIAEAAFAQMTGRPKLAAKLYEKACEKAGAAGFVHNYGLACELTAKLHLEQGRRHLARAYMSEAYRAYGQWGARAKAVRLLGAHRDLILDESASPLGEADYRFAMEAIQTLSSEIRLDRLLRSLMELAMRSAGARRGVLALAEEGRFYVEARAAGREARLERVPLERADDLPQAILAYVARTGEDAVLRDASREGLFADHPDVRRRELKSVLCLPMTKGGLLIGLLYLENNLTTGAFAAERVHLLKLLCSQCAVSIENAQLYASSVRMKRTLEDQVEERTRALEASIRETAAALAEASIQSDRNRIAADVHDIMGHTITSSLLQLEAAKLQFRRDPEDAESRLSGVQQLLKRGLKEIRDSIRMLRESGKGNPAQEWRQLIESLESGADIRIEADIGELPELDANDWRALYHALREGVTNGIRHGGADRFRFSLRLEDGELRFRLTNNGAEPREGIVPGFGLTAMRERVEAMGGRLAAAAERGRGCLLKIDVPLSQRRGEVVR